MHYIARRNTMAMPETKSLVLHVLRYIRFTVITYVSVVHLYGYSANGHFSTSVRVWYYCIFCDRYIKYLCISEGKQNG